MSAAAPAGSGNRLFKGVLANLFAVFSRIGTQFVLVPLLFASWDAALVGVWLLLSTIPSYLNLAATGFGTAGANIAVEAGLKGDDDHARAVFRAAWLAVTASNLVLVAALLAMSGWLLRASVFHAAHVADNQVTEAILWMCVYTFLTVQGGILEIPFRKRGHYPQYIFLTSLISLAELAVTAAVVASTTRLAMLPLALSVTRLVLLAVSLGWAWRMDRGLFGRPRPGETVRALARLWQPSLGFMAAPLVFAFNLQGYSLLVGAWLGPVVLASFIATRILVRGLEIISNFTYSVQFYEFAYLREGTEALMRRTYATLTLLMVLVSAGYLAALALAGPAVLAIWTLGKAHFDVGIAIALGLSGAIRAVTMTPSAILSSRNRNARFMAAYTASSAASFAVAAYLASRGCSLHVLGICLVAAELGLLLVFREANKVVHYSVGALVRDMASLGERWQDVTRLVHDIRRGAGRPQPNEAQPTEAQPIET